MRRHWLRDHFPTRIKDESATLIDIPQALVSRYGKLQEKQRGMGGGNDALIDR
jgi:hypothetical protein